MFTVTMKKDAKGLPTKSRPETPSLSRDKMKEAPRKSLAPLSDIITERLKQPMCNRQRSAVMGRTSSGIPSKVFKPQLEDIKSSYLLLNKKTNEENNNEEDKRKLLAPKPTIVDETRRKQQLIEVKQKFQSKGFFEDSRYDKIEGLNWISWK